MRNTLTLLNISVMLLSGSLSVFCFSQDNGAKGILIYKLNDYSEDSSALAAEYSEIQISSAMVNATTTDGSRLRITATRYVTAIPYPNLSSGTFQFPNEIEELMKIGREMVSVSEEIPSSAPILAPVILDLKTAATKLNSGFVIKNGKFVDTTTIPTPAMSQTVIRTLSGEELVISKVLDADSASVRIMHDGGIKSFLWFQLDESSQKLIKELPEVQYFLTAPDTPKITSEEVSLPEDQLNAFDVLSSAFFNGNGGRRLSTVPPSQQGAWRVVRAIDALTLDEAAEKVSSSTLLTGLITPSIEVKETSIRFANIEHKIKYVSTNADESTLFIFSGDVFVVKNSDVFIFLDAAKTIDMVSVTLTRNVSPSFVRNQPIVQAIFEGVKQ